MRDENGIYYHVQPGNSNIRVYVRKNDLGEIEFRLWVRDQPQVWDKHEWLTYDTIKRAAELYHQERNPDAQPLKIYDPAIAKALLKEASA